MMEYGYAKLKGRIVEKYGSQSEFARALGISRQTMYEKMNCKTGISQKDIEQWSDMLNINKSEIPEYFFS